MDMHLHHLKSEQKIFVAAFKGCVAMQAFHCTSATSVEQEQARQRLKTCEQKAEIGERALQCF